MVTYPLPSKFSTQPRRSSDPTWTQRTSANVFTPSRALSRGKNYHPLTAGVPQALKSPYMTPELTQVRHGRGTMLPMKLIRAKDIHRSKAPSSTNALGRARPLPKNSPYVKIPPISRVSWSLPRPELVLPPMQGTPRKVEQPQPWDPSRPTVQLFRVMNKCWDDDTVKESRWTVRDGLLNGRNDERDRSAMWSDLSVAVRNVWPDLRNWIMLNTPTDDDTWFKSAGSICAGERLFICDPLLATKGSSLEPVGFHMDSNTYDAACKIMQQLAGHSTDLREINPFFVIYACADCNLPLPSNISRQFLWKHLDGLLRFKCWRGLRSGRANTERHTHLDADLPPKLSRKRTDPDDTLESLLRISYKTRARYFDYVPAPAPTANDVPRPVHKLCISIRDYAWVVNAKMGTIWYKAGDLYDENDIACFAIIDCLTRLLPSCQGSILEITTDHLCLMWGVGGPPSGAWSVVQALCMKNQVSLRGKWSDHPGPDPYSQIHPSESTILPRNSNMVKAAFDWFVHFDLNLDSSRAAYKCMMNHLEYTT